MEGLVLLPQERTALVDIHAVEQSLQTVQEHPAQEIRVENILVQEIRVTGQSVQKGVALTTEIIPQQGAGVEALHAAAVHAAVLEVRAVEAIAEAVRVAAEASVAEALEEALVAEAASAAALVAEAAVEAHAVEEAEDKTFSNKRKIQAQGEKPWGVRDNRHLRYFKKYTIWK